MSHNSRALWGQKVYHVMPIMGLNNKEWSIFFKSLENMGQITLSIAK